MRRPDPEFGGSGGPDGPIATQYPPPLFVAAIPTAWAMLLRAFPWYFAVPAANTLPSPATSHRPRVGPRRRAMPCRIDGSRVSPTIGLDAGTAAIANASPKL